jgi:hypothetical protein
LTMRNHPDIIPFPSAGNIPDSNVGCAKMNQLPFFLFVPGIDTQKILLGACVVGASH